MHNQTAAGVHTDAGTLTVAEYPKRWLETSARRSVRHGTLTRYEQLVRLRLVPHLGGVRLGQLTPAHVEQLFTELTKQKVSSRGQQMAGNVLGRTVKGAVRLRLVSTNPVRDAVKPKPAKGEMKAWDDAQVTRFLKTAKRDRLYALYVTATAMRSGELFALEWGDIDWDAGAVIVHRSLEEVNGRLAAKEVKTAKGKRRVDLPESVLAALRQHREQMNKEGRRSKVVFCDEQGGWLRRPNVANRSFRPLIRQAELPRLRFHDLRHASASLLLLENVHPKRG